MRRHGCVVKEMVDEVKMTQVAESDHSVNTRTKQELQGRSRLWAAQSCCWEEEEVSEGWLWSR